MPFKVIQGHLGYLGTNRKSMWRATSYQSLILSRTVSKFLQIIGKICVFDKGVPVFNTLVWVELLDSQPRNLASIETLETSLYRVVQNVFRYTVQALITSVTDTQTDGRTGRCQQYRGLTTRANNNAYVKRPNKTFDVFFQNESISQTNRIKSHRRSDNGAMHVAAVIEPGRADCGPTHITISYKLQYASHCVTDVALHRSQLRAFNGHIRTPYARMI